MARFPLEVFTQGSALLGFNDRYKSSLLNQKFAGFPKGVYFGFVPSVSPPSPILTLDVDPTEGISLLKVPSSVDPGGMDIIIDYAITMDFTGQPPGDFPINVIGKVQYTDDPSVATVGSLVTRSAGPMNFDEVLVCRVDGPDTALSVTFDPAAGERDAPLSYAGVRFGFMPAGSVEDLIAAVDEVNEVTAARLGLDGVTYGSLSDRLSADLSAASLASRLARRVVVLRSNDYLAEAGATTINISGSFSEVNRDHEPKISLDGLGSETTTGAVAAPNDEVRNIAVVQDTATGFRTLDDPTSSLVVFGRIIGPTDESAAGVFSFQNAQKSVSITDGQITETAETGDLLQGADGKFYEIAAIYSDSQLELSDAYTGPTASSGGLITRRWLLALKKISGSTEIPASLSEAATIRCFFPAFLTSSQSNFDWRTAQMTPGGRPPIPDASTTVPGRVVLTQADSRLGSINVRKGSAGTPVLSSLPSGRFHTINFIDGNGLVTQTSAGEASVGRIGATGPQGPDGQSGGIGPDGDQGAGFSQITPFKISGTYAGPGVGTTNYSWTTSMGHTIRNLAVQIARYWDSGFFTTTEFVEITDLQGVSSTSATVVFTLGGDSLCKLLVSSAGD